MHRLQDLHLGGHTGFQVLHRRILNAICPEEFFKIHRVHPVDLLKSHREGFYRFVLRSQQRTGFDIIKPPVLHQKFDRCAGIGALLNFIEEHQRLPRLHGLPGISGQICEDRADIQITRKDVRCICVRDEVDLHKAFVILFSEFPNQRRLADLPRAKNTESLMIAVIFPIQKLLISLSAQHSPHLIPFVCRHCNIILHSYQSNCDIFL